MLRILDRTETCERTGVVEAFLYSLNNPNTQNSALKPKPSFELASVQKLPEILTNAPQNNKDYSNSETLVAMPAPSV